MLNWLLVVLLSLGVFANADAEPRKDYRLSTVVGGNFAWGRTGERWAELVRERTSGRINIVVYPGASLVGGDVGREFAALKGGSIDLAVGSSINWANQVKQLHLFALPFLVADYRDLDRLTQGDVGRELARTLERSGVILLAWGENGFRELANSRRPVRAPADIKGLRLRIGNSPLLVDTFTSLGARPVQLSFADVVPALSAGTLDGLETPLGVFAGAKLYMVGQQHLSLWAQMADPLLLAVSQKVWESWPFADREIVRDCARQAAAENVRAVRKGTRPGDDELLREVAGHGVSVVQLSALERRAFQVATRPVYEKWALTIGSELVRQAELVLSRP